MTHNPFLILLLWLLGAFLLQGLLRRILERTFPTWYEQRHRDAATVAAAGAFLLALGGVVAVVLIIDLIWPAA